MSGFYDIYALSDKRNEQTIKAVLSHFCDREKIQVKDYEFSYFKHKDGEETWAVANSLEELIGFGIANPDYSFAWYNGEHLKKDIKQIILKFTFDQKIIFGICIAGDIYHTDGQLTDNYLMAVEIEKTIAKLTGAGKTSIQFEYPPAADEKEFDEDMEVWKAMNDEKRNDK